MALQEYMKGKKKWMALVLLLIAGPVASYKYAQGPEPQGTKAIVYVDTMGVPAGIADRDVGSSVLPCASVNQAMRLADRLSDEQVFVMVQPGEYVESGPVVWAKRDNVYLIGAAGGGAVTITANSAKAVLVIRPADVGETFDAYIGDIEIDHVDGQIGLLVVNDELEHKLVLTVEGLSTNAQGAGASISVVHGSPQAVHFYITNSGQEIEGPIHYAVGDTNDRLQVTGTTLSEPVTLSGIDRVGQFRFIRCLFDSGACAISEVVHEVSDDVGIPEGLPQFSLIQCITSDPQMRVYGCDTFRAAQAGDVSGPCTVQVID